MSADDSGKHTQETRAAKSFSVLKDFHARVILTAAAILHLSVAIVIHLIGRFELLPDLFDSHGIGTAFNIDSVSYLAKIISLTDLLKDGNLYEWFYAGHLHEQTYSLFFIFLRPLFGDGILCAEPLNLFYYLSIIALVGSLGWMLFDKTSALVAMSVCAVFPSLLLHTVQLLRDPLFIAAFLLLGIVQIFFITRAADVKDNLISSVVGCAALLVLWKIRGNFWELIISVTAIGFVLFLFRFCSDARRLKFNFSGVSILLASALLMPYLTDSKRNQFRALPPGAEPPAQISQTLPVAERIVKLRRNFYRRYPHAGSNIDQDVSFENVADIVGFLPRALLVGLAAPFPDMWFEGGKSSGVLGHAASGIETFAMYLFQILALGCFWRHKKQIEIWYVFLVVLLVSLALGLVVVNIGALYRMRYISWIFIIILASNVPALFWKSFLECGSKMRRN